MGEQKLNSNLVVEIKRGIGYQWDFGPVKESLHLQCWVQEFKPL